MPDSFAKLRINFSGMTVRRELQMVKRFIVEKVE